VVIHGVRERSAPDEPVLRGSDDGRIGDTSAPIGGSGAYGRCVLGGVGFEPDGAEVVSAGEADVCVEGGGEAAQEGDGGLGAVFLDALDVVVGQVGADGQFGDGQAKGGADVVCRLPLRR
jgi:hypothetical protein